MSDRPRHPSGPPGRIPAEALRQALGRSVDAVALIDEERRHLHVNAAYARLFGYDEPRELHRLEWRAVHPGDELVRLEDEAGRALETRGSWRGEAMARTREGEPVSVDLTLTRLPGGRLLCVARDLTEHREVRQRLERMAYYDPLTGLANRRLLREKAEQAFAMAERRRHDVALLYLDLDSFKEINDTLGHASGDRVLEEVARRLEETVRDADTAARVGGDEFAVLLGEVEGEAGAVHVARRVQQGLEPPVEIEDHSLRMGASIGLSLYPRHADRFEDLMRQADLAMYGAGRTKSVGVRVYRPEEGILTPRHSGLYRELHDALRHYRFEVHYQPIRRLDSGRIEGAEALVRWPHSRLGVLSAAKFLPLVEESGMLQRLDRWVLATSLLQLEQWSEDGFDGWVAVHVSEASCDGGELPGYVRRTLDAAGLPPDRLVLQLPGRVVLGLEERYRALRNQLSELGVRTAVRAFGPGNPDVKCLRAMAPEVLSLDRSLVETARGEPTGQQRIQVAVDVAHTLGAQVLAKGVERPGQRQLLQAAGCDFSEGYLEGWSVPAEQFMNGAGD